jgi:hypothetical protein
LTPGVPPVTGRIAGPLDPKINAIATVYAIFFETFDVMACTFGPTRRVPRLRFC